MHIRRIDRPRIIGAAIGLCLVAVACGSDEDQSADGVERAATTPTSPSATTTETTKATTTTLATVTTETTADLETLHLTVIGDSIPHHGFCTTCVAFDTLYAAEIEARVSRPVAVANRSRNDSAGVGDIVTQVTDDADLRELITGSDLVIVSVGFNNVLPDAVTASDMSEQFGGDWGCVGDMGTTVEGYITWALATTPECLQAQIDAYAAHYETIFSTIAGLRGDEPTMLIALNVYDSNLASPEVRDADLSEEQLAVFERWMIDAYERWNPMMCAVAVRHGFVCADIYHAFNGADGTTPTGTLTVDGAHPSQSGHDLIAEVLADIDTDGVFK